MAAILGAQVALLAPPTARAQETGGEQRWDAKFQSTYVWQLKPGFRAPYSGPNSLAPQRERSYTFTATAYLGSRPWSGGELYLNPEAVQGVPLSGVHGLGGLTNGEIQKSAGPTLRYYRARLFYRHTLGLGGGSDEVESDQNRLAGRTERRRLTVTAGNLAVVDLFGTSDVAGDPRTQFLNWSSLTYGHYDYAADSRGFSWGVAADLAWDAWSVRAGRFLLPRLPNQLRLDPRIGRRYGDQVELEHRHGEGDWRGALKLLTFRNVARMAAYADQRDAPCDLARVGPDEECVRRVRSKAGWGVSLEQSLGPWLRVLARGGAADGRSETYAFAEIDASLFFAVSVSGALWGRARDALGLSFAQNHLSAGHREFLRRGGLGFFIGDGTLAYRPERIVEAYLSVSPMRAAAVSLGVQRIVNPAYNADRGPVTVGTVRVHVEF